MDNERNSRHFESVYSQKVRAGKRRTYFFDVRRTKGEDYYLTLTESSRRMDGGYDRHKIFLYKEDLNRFVATLEETVNYIKTELMPQYDYDEFTRRQDEYEARMLEEREATAAEKTDINGGTEEAEEIPVPVKTELKTIVTVVPRPIVTTTYEAPKASPPIDDEEDMAW
ncbi:MAG: DUF3276 family protein [Saprospiraceae bacterium]|nr:DUF3276 family protein [Saprospiraceae bacterium]